VTNTPNLMATVNTTAAAGSMRGSAMGCGDWNVG